SPASVIGWPGCSSAAGTRDSAPRGIAARLARRRRQTPGKRATRGWHAGTLATRASIPPRLRSQTAAYCLARSASPPERSGQQRRTRARPARTARPAGHQASRLLLAQALDVSHDTHGYLQTKPAVDTEPAAEVHVTGRLVLAALVLSLQLAGQPGRMRRE